MACFHKWRQFYLSVQSLLLEMWDEEQVYMLTITIKNFLIYIWFLTFQSVFCSICYDF